MAGKTRDKQRRDAAQIVLQVGSTLTSSLVLEQVLPTIARQVGEAMDVWACDIHEYDPQTRSLTYVGYWCRGGVTAEDEAFYGTVDRLDERPTWLPVIEGRQTCIGDIDDPDMATVDREMMERWGEKTVVDTPLVYGDQVIGVLGLVESRKNRRFTPEDLALLEQLAAPAAIAIHNARLYKAQEERSRRLTSLLESSRALTSTVDLDELLGLVVQQAVGVLQASEGIIYEYDEVTRTLTYRAVCSLGGTAPEDQEYVGTSFSVDDFASDRAVLLGDGVVEQHTSDCDLPEDRRASMERYHEVTSLSVPLTSDERPLGILRVYETEHERRYTDDEREMLSALGELASAAISNARLFRRQQKQSERLVSLFETSRLIAASFEIRDVMACVHGEVAHLVDDHAGDVGVYLRTAGGAYLPFEDALGGSPDGEPDCASSAPEQQAIAEVRPVQARVDGEASLVVPFAAKGVTQGYIVVRSSILQSFDEDDVELVQILANQAATAVENAGLYKRIERLAITDGLTGIYNHRYFFERLTQECARARRYGTALSLLMLDIDDFKQFNDEYGHPLGDQVLRDVARILHTGLRRGVDLAARYGGEEFVVILPHTPIDGAGVVSERLQQQVAQLGAATAPREAAPLAVAPSVAESPASAEEPPTPGAEVVGERIRHEIAETLFPGHGGRRYEHVTVSIGIASFGGGLGDADRLVRGADKALYLAKHRGKNRVEIYE